MLDGVIGAGELLNWFTEGKSEVSVQSQPQHMGIFIGP